MSAADWATTRREMGFAHCVELDGIRQKLRVLEQENRTMKARIHDDGVELKVMASNLAQLKKELSDNNNNMVGQQPVDEISIITALSDDDDDAFVVGSSGAAADGENAAGVQRTNWLIRHTGSKRLTCNIFFRPCDETAAPSLVDEIVSLKDDIGTTYTSFVYASRRIRATSLEKSLRCAVGVTGFKVTDLSKQTRLDSRHFQKLVDGVRFKHNNIKIDTVNQLTHFDRIYKKLLLRA